jgi:glycosyltransferase involved in cell wall biosynthesis
MNVLYCNIVPVWPLTMTAVGHTRLVQRMVAAGHRVVASTALYTDETDARLATGAIIEPFNPFHVDRFSTWRELKYMIWSVLFLFQYLKLWRKYRSFDVICLRNAFVGWCIPIIRRLFHARCVISITDIMSGFLLWNDAYPRWLVRMCWKLEIWIISRFDLIFCVTDEMKQLLVDEGISADKIRISLDGVDPTLFDPANLSPDLTQPIENEIGLNHPRVLFYGNIHPQNVDYLVAIMRETHSRNPNIGFVVIGKGDGHDKLKNIAPGNAFIHLGYKPHDRLPAYINACDVGVIPYLHSQNSDSILTLKLLECGAMGLPIVSTPLRAIYQLFNHEEWIHFADDPIAFAQAIDEMIKHPKNSKQADFFRERYDWNRIMDRVIADIESDYENYHR